MTQPDAEQITPDTATPLRFRALAKKAPHLIPRIPGMLKGLKIVANTDPTKPLGLGLAFEETAKHHPDAVAILCDEQRYTYREINEWANQIAHYLSSKGFIKGDVIAIVMENKPELLVSVLAAAKLGVISALLNTSQKPEALAHSITLVKPSAIIVGMECEPTVRALSLDKSLTYFSFADQAITVKPDYHDLDALRQDQPIYNPPSSQKIYLKDPCFYIYTSGTTGLPKAGIFSHGRWSKAYGGFGLSTLQLNTNDTLYCTLPLYHATGIVICWSSAIAGGAGFAIRRKFSASAFWEDARKYHATCISYVGELCRYLMASPARTDDRHHSVTKMLGNGLRPTIWQDFKRRFGIDEVYEFYGASEGNIGFTNVFNLDNTVGFSPQRYAIVKYDRDAERPVRNAKGRCLKIKRGESGLLIGEINKLSPLDGYTEADKTEKTVLRNVFRQGDAWFNTGDLMRDIGYRHAQFVDRLGDTFRWKGENVSTTEVENALQALPLISTAVVYGIEIPNTNGRAGMAVCVLSEDATQNADNQVPELYQQFTTILAEYAIPLFLRIKTQLETTDTFKIKKTQLKAEAYDTAIIQDPIWVKLPGNKTYQRLDSDLQQAINQGKYRF